jgi:hypothetical protein
MGNFSTAAKNTMLNALTVDRVQLHSGDPGASGTSNVISNTMVTATVATASSGERLLSSDVSCTGLTALQAVTHVSFWSYNGGTPVFHGSDDITGDQAANAAGEYTVKASTTKLSLTNPA